MEPLAGVEDVEALWRRPLAGAEIEAAEMHLASASSIVRRRVPTVDTRLASGELEDTVVRSVVASMVLRVMRNPDGLRSRTVGAVAVTWDDPPTVGLAMTAEEFHLLAPPRTRPRVRSVALKVCWP